MRISDWSSDVCSSDLCCTSASTSERVARSLGNVRSQASRVLMGPARPAGLWGECPPASAWRRMPPPLFHPKGLQATPGSDRRLAPKPSPSSREAMINFPRSEEQTTELQSIMHNSYADVCLQKKKKKKR